VRPGRFDYVRSESVEHACVALASYDGGARPLAGGQSLVPLLNLRLALPEALVDLNRIDGLADLTVADGAVRVGALVRQRTLERAAGAVAACPLLGLALGHVGHVATRNRGTVCGSLAHADPAGELPAVLACLGGSVVAEGVLGRREITAAALFGGHYTTSLSDDEIVVEARFPVTEASWGHAFEEVALRHGDYAQAMVACALRVAADGTIAEVRLAAGALADRPLCLDAAESLLAGAAIGDDGALAAAGEAAAAAVEPPDTDVAPATYRRHLTAVLVVRAVRRAHARGVAA